METDFQKLVNGAAKIRELARFGGGEKFSLSFSPDGQWLASGGDDGTIRLWNPETGQELRRLEGHAGTVNSVCFSPDGRWLASGSDDKTVRLWNPETGKELRRLEGHSEYVYSVCFSPDGRWLASGSQDQTIRLWNPETGKELRRLEGHSSNVRSICFSPDGRWLASGSDDKTIRLWNPETGKERWRLEGHTQNVYSVCFSPDGQWLASGSGDKTIRLWNPETGKELRCLEGHTAYVHSVCFSPDGRVLASGGGDHEIGFWEVASGKCIKILRRESATVGCIAIDPAGHWLACGKKPTQIWDISSLDVGPKVEALGVTRLSAAGEQVVAAQLATLPFGHEISAVTEVAAAWWRHSASLGQTAPLFLVRDLGLVLSRPAAGLQLARPGHLPADLPTGPYLALLQRLAALPAIRQFSSWQPKEGGVGVVLARLFSGCEFPQEYSLPVPGERVALARVLATRLRAAEPARIWQETAPAQRPNFAAIMTAPLLARLETQARALNLEELRLLHQYGPRLAGSPDPRELLDAFNLLGLPASLRLSLGQVLRLIPRISRKVGGNHAQTYALGGYAGLARKGNLDSLLPTELAYPEDFFWHRLLNHEAMYYAWESESEKRRELAVIITQMGVEIQGDGDVLARGLTLALARILAARGWVVWQSFAGHAGTEAVPLDQPAGLHQLLYYRDPQPVNPGAALERVLAWLRGWSEDFRQIQVFWVLDEHWDADDGEEHRALYAALRQKARQEAWFIRTGTGRLAPPSAQQFDRHEIIGTECLWPENQPPVKEAHDAA